jgi:PPOX class probable F420-dependent enzyme
VSSPAETEDPLWQLVGQRREGVLATLQPDGRPQLSNVLYLFDQPSRLIRISTTADRIKARNAAPDPRVALHVSGDNFWAYAVAEGMADLSQVASTPGDQAIEELRQIHSSFYSQSATDEGFDAEMIANRRLVLRIHVKRVYGVISTGGRRPVAPAADDG